MMNLALQPHYCKADVSGSPLSELYNMDCVLGMKHYPDKYFDLAICDPPYGIGASEMTMGRGKKKWNKGKNWDNETPLLEYFIELFRVSKNQIIWGGNYFTDKLPVSRCWIYWDKDVQPDLSFAAGELAWCSFDKVLKKAPVDYSGFRGADNGGKIHPTQKPIKLYDWILANYANEGMKILDTHSGSGSLRISYYQNKFDFVGFEIDSHYCEMSHKRFKNSISQQKLF